MKTKMGYTPNMMKAIIFERYNQPFKVEYSERTVINLIKEGDGRAFEKIFREYFKSLHAYAYTFMKDDEQAEEIVQNVFCRIWEKRDQLNPDGSIKAYLYRAVHNESVNYLKHQKTRTAFRVHYNNSEEQIGGEASEKVMTAELDGHIQQALNELPQQCRIIFQMSRFENLKYREIADQLNLSVKTVENQMGKALKVLRTKLAEFLPVVLYIIAWLYK
ncbi:RNA polymerase sigma-70 factor [Mucilaginibacter phenanthrenivorans]|uniref:RNA polymerase sigma-70 factor n=1 Tax=Mucilaginibacter phenanthrenivorans TaxID=1234842 RepID=UPI0021572872|nr:RNA polymerase sigma-70 factor [Mucilaginibacter phenanthrenivorans]